MPSEAALIHSMGISVKSVPFTYSAVSPSIPWQVHVGAYCSQVLAVHSRNNAVTELEMGNDTSSLQEQINATAPSPAPPSPLEDAVVTRSPDTLQQFNWRHYCSRGCAPPDANRDECRALDALRFVRTLGLVQKRGDVDSALPLWRIVNSHNVMRRVLLMARIESAVSGPRTISTDARPISAAAAFQQRHSQGICTDPAPFSGSTGEAAQSSVPHSSHGGGSTGRKL